MKRIALPFRMRSIEALVIVIILAAASAIILYMRDATHKIREALPAEVLEQQRDIATILQHLAELRRAVEVGRLTPGSDSLVRIRALAETSIGKLRAVRQNYHFDDLTGATTLLAIVDPAMRDIQRWLESGIQGHSGGSQVVLELVFLRLDDIHQQVQTLFHESNRTAAGLVRSQTTNLEHLRDALQSYLFIFACFAAGVLILFVRQLNAEARLSLARKRLGDSIESINEGFTLLDENDRLVLCNRRFNELYPAIAATTYTGMPFEEICRLGCTNGPVVSIDGQTEGLFENRIHRHRSPGTPFEVQLRDGRWVLVSERRTREGGSVQTHTEITELKKAQRRLEELATHDRLTGLPNRAHFEERLNHALAHSRRHGTETALLFLDLDHFKRINDSYGHSSGDILLQTTAERVTGALRGGDTISRLGGDEFTVVIESVMGWAEVSATAERILSAISKPVSLVHHEVVVTASIGIALYPRDGTDVPALLKTADAACYHAKGQGRHNFQFYTQEMNRKAFQRLELEERLRSAVNGHEFALHFQPIFEISTGAVVAMEALLRWRRNDLGDVPPEIFIPLCEESGLIDELGDWVISEACRQNAAWRKQGLGDFRVSVNLAARQLRHGDLNATINRALRAAGLPADGFAVEISEGTVGTGMHQASGVLDQIKSSGVGIMLDDFGAGASSLATLKRLPFSFLKIDLSLVQDIVHDADDREIVFAVIAMAKQLRFSAVAEGVETKEQFAMLVANGLDLAQGHFLGSAMSGQDATHFLGLLRDRPSGALQSRFSSAVDHGEDEADGKPAGGTKVVSLGGH